MKSNKMRSKSESAKIHSHLSKDINRISKIAEAQTKMNILRKHQVKLLNEFLDKLLDEKRITKQEVKLYLPRKKETERILFKK